MSYVYILYFFVIRRIDEFVYVKFFFEGNFFGGCGFFFLILFLIIYIFLDIGLGIRCYFFKIIGIICSMSLF